MADHTTLMEEAAGGLDIVVFPWLAFGHMIPYLELAKRLAARGHAVAFVSTPRNLARLPPVPPRLSPLLRFVPLRLPHVDGLPEGAESTADLLPGNDELLKKAMDGLAAPLDEYIAGACDGGSKPDWIVHDFCHHWVPPIADKHKVPCAVFKIVLAGLSACIGSRGANAANPRMASEDFTVAPVWYPLPSTAAYRRHEAGWIAGAFKPNASGVADIERSWQINERCRVTIYRSCHKIESGMFALLTDLFQRPSVPAGILLPSHDLAQEDDVRSDVLQWLDDQPPKSVIYVALGSEAPLTTENLHELVLGLELAGVRFLWVLRKPNDMFRPGVNDDGADEIGMLPDGFKERTSGRSMVHTGWVPQVKALANGAVSAFLTHCGWGSTIESFAFGLPLVMLTFIIDQPLVARTMVEMGIGTEVVRDDSDGSFDRNSVAAAVCRVMVEDEGKVFANNAKELQKVLVDQGRQEQYIDDLVEHLRRYK